MAGINSIPAMSVPDIGAEEHENGLRFRIVNAHGVITVTGRHEHWHCTGRGEALATAGLIDMAWLPGLPGNNRTSQTVCFGEGGPELYRGNPNGRRLADNIRIRRLSADRFEVVVPATAAQKAVLKDVNSRYFDRLRRENEANALEDVREAIAERERNVTPEDAKTAMALHLEILAQSISAAERAGLQFDAASARSIDGHLAALRAALAGAALHRAPSEFTGNVVPLFVRGV